MIFGYIVELFNLSYCWIYTIVEPLLLVSYVDRFSSLCLPKRTKIIKNANLYTQLFKKIVYKDVHTYNK